MTVQSPENVSNSSTESVKENKTPDNKPSPAQDLRDIQQLLVSGVFQGNMAPAVVRSYQILEQMAAKIEAAAKEKE